MQIVIHVQRKNPGRIERVLRVADREHQFDIRRLRQRLPRMLPQIPQLLGADFALPVRQSAPGVVKLHVLLRRRRTTAFHDLLGNRRPVRRRTQGTENTELVGRTLVNQVGTLVNISADAVHLVFLRLDMLIAACRANQTDRITNGNPLPERIIVGLVELKIFQVAAPHGQFSAPLTAQRPVTARTVKKRLPDRTVFRARSTDIAEHRLVERPRPLAAVFHAVTEPVFRMLVRLVKHPDETVQRHDLPPGAIKNHRGIREVVAVRSARLRTAQLARKLRDALHQRLVFGRVDMRGKLVRRIDAKDFTRLEYQRVEHPDALDLRFAVLLDSAHGQFTDLPVELPLFNRLSSVRIHRKIKLSKCRARHQ